MLTSILYVHACMLYTAWYNVAIQLQLEMEKLSLRNEHKRDTDRRMRDIEAEMKDLQAKQSELTEVWDKERGAVGKVNALLTIHTVCGTCMLYSNQVYTLPGGYALVLLL
jgi:Flp pilus assembly protein TadB